MKNGEILAISNVSNTIICVFVSSGGFEGDRSFHPRIGSVVSHVCCQAYVMLQKMLLCSQGYIVEFKRMFDVTHCTLLSGAS